MAGFERTKGEDRGSRERTISSLALTAGDLVDFDRANAKVIKATSSSTPESLAGVVDADATSSDTLAKLQLISEHDTFKVDSANNSNASHNYQRMVLTDENTVNNTGTDSTADAAIVTQVDVVGTASDKKIVVEFVTRQDRA